MKPSKIYRNAAKSIEDGELEFSCEAITAAVRPEWNGGFYELPVVQRYLETFAPEGRNYEMRAVRLQNAFEVPDGKFNDSANDDRIIALCFMACIAEDE